MSLADEVRETLDRPLRDLRYAELLEHFSSGRSAASADQSGLSIQLALSLHDATSVAILRLAERLEQSGHLGGVSED